MSKEKVISAMVSFIEKKEKEAQLKKVGAENHEKIDVVKAILDELEREMKNEN